MSRKYTCCFTGHRNIPYDEYEQLSLDLFNTVKLLIKEGYISFVTGGAVGFDTLCAQTVLLLKRTYPMIRLTVVAPFLNQSSSFSAEEKLAYNEIQALADDFVVLRMNYQKGCMQERNIKMVDISSCCVAYLSDRKSGTGQTVAYAEKNNLRVINLKRK